MDVGAALNLGNPQGPQTPGQAAPQMGQPTIPGSDFIRKNVSQEWSQFLSNPNAKAFLMQAGLAMMQPMGLGQDRFGHWAQAFGQGAAAAGRQQKAREDTALERERLQVQREGNRSQTQLSLASLMANDRALAAAFEQEIDRFVMAEKKRLDPYDLNLDPNNTENAIRQRILSDPNMLEQIQRQWLAARSYPGRSATSVAPTLGSALGPGGAAPGAAPAAGAVPGAGKTPTPAAIEKLKANPALAPQFDQMFGPGAAKRALGG